MVVVRWFSNLIFFCRIMDIAYCIVMTLISSKVCLMLSLWNLNVFSMLSIKEVCVVALIPTVMTISGSIFHPLLMILSISALYLFIFFIIVSYGILSLQYVNSMNCFVRLLLGYVGGGD